MTYANAPFVLLLLRIAPTKNTLTGCAVPDQLHQDKNSVNQDMEGNKCFPVGPPGGKADVVPGAFFRRLGSLSGRQQFSGSLSSISFMDISEAGMATIREHEPIAEADATKEVSMFSLVR